MLNYLSRMIRRWSALQHVKDYDAMIRHHRGMLDNLPAEIQRLEMGRRTWAGRAATMAQRRDPVNYRLAGSSKRMR